MTDFDYDRVRAQPLGVPVRGPTERTPATFAEDVQTGSTRGPGNDLESVLGTLPKVVHELGALPDPDDFNAGDVVLVDGQRHKLAIVVDNHLRSGAWSTAEVATGGGTWHWKGVSARNSGLAPGGVGAWDVNPDMEVLFFGFTIRSEIDRGPLQIAIRRSSYRAAIGRDEADGDKVSVSIIWATDQTTFVLTYSGDYMTYTGNHESYIIFEMALQPPGIVYDGEYVWLKAPENYFDMLTYKGDIHDSDDPTSDLIFYHPIDTKHWVDFYDARENENYHTGRVNSGRLDVVEGQIRQIEDHGGGVSVGGSEVEILDRLPHPTNAMPARAVVRIHPNDSRTAVTYVAKTGGVVGNGWTFVHEYDSTASPLKATVDQNDKRITIGFGAATKTIRQWCDAIAALDDFPSDGWHADPWHYAPHSVAVASDMPVQTYVSEYGIDAPGEALEYVRIESLYRGRYTGGGDWFTLPGLYRLLDYPAGLEGNRFRARFVLDGTRKGFYVAANYPPPSGPGHNFGEMIFDPTAGSIAGLYLDSTDEFGGNYASHFVLGEEWLFAAMVDRVRYVWATVDDPRKRSDENSGGIRPVTVNPHDFDPTHVIHDNLVARFYSADGTNLRGDIPFNSSTGAAVWIGGKKFRIFESFLVQAVFDDAIDATDDGGYVDVEVVLDVDHAFNCLRDWYWPMPQSQWGDQTGLKATGTPGVSERTKAWVAVDTWHPTVSRLNQELADIRGLLGGMRLKKMSQSDYDALPSKDGHTIYFTYGSDQSSRRIYIGGDRWE